MPKAEVFADVWLTESVTHNSDYTETYHTGKKQVINEIFLFGLKIYEKSVVKEFENSETETFENIITKNNTLPFLLKKTVVYETATRRVQQTFNDVQSGLEKNIREKNLQKVFECEIILKEDIVIREQGNITCISHTITLNRNIGE